MNGDAINAKSRFLAAGTKHNWAKTSSGVVKFRYSEKVKILKKITPNVSFWFFQNFVAFSEYLSQSFKRSLFIPFVEIKKVSFKCFKNSNLTKTQAKIYFQKKFHPILIISRVRKSAGFVFRVAAITQLHFTRKNCQ